MKISYLFFLLFILFSGCSSTNITLSDKTISHQEIDTSSEEESLEDEFDEFSDEMEAEVIYDPLSGYNRIMTDINDKFYIHLLIPVAKGYKAVVHSEIRKSVGNFFHNIYFPIRLVNNLLQAKFQNASEETGRFVINTTLGVAGLFDPAKSEFELEAHDEDFGQTLGFYGVGGGAHIVLPLLGPSNLRDAISKFPDSYLSPISSSSRDYYALKDTTEEFIAVKTYEYINELSMDVGMYEKLKKDAVDLYPYLRDVYEQRREKQIKE